TTPWPASARSRVAGVSAFGFSGTNAHVVLEEAPERPANEAEADESFHLLTLSAKSPQTLRRVAERYAAHLAEPAHGRLGDVCFTASACRAHFEHRLAVVSDSCDGVRRALEQYAEGKAPGGLIVG